MSGYFGVWNECGDLNCSKNEWKLFTRISEGKKDSDASE